MAKQLQRRSTPPQRKPSEPYIRNCHLTIENEIREFGDAYGWLNYEYTGRRFGTFEAELVGDIDLNALMAGPVVFEWPDQEMFIAMQVVKGTKTLPWRELMVVHITGHVLGVASYGSADALTRQRAQVNAKRFLSPAQN